MPSDHGTSEKDGTAVAQESDEVHLSRKCAWGILWKCHELTISFLAYYYKSWNFNLIVFHEYSGSPREIRSVTEMLLCSGHPLHGLPTSDNNYSPKSFRHPEGLKYGPGESAEKHSQTSDRDILKEVSGGPNVSSPKCIDLDYLVNQEINNSFPGSGNLSVKALRKTGLRIQEVAGTTPILYNDLQVPITNARKL